MEYKTLPSASQSATTSVAGSETDSVSSVATRDVIATPYGYVTVTRAGKIDQIENVLVTYHDVGMNHTLCWERFLQHPKLSAIFSSFHVLHIDAPGHSAKEGPLSTFPKFEELATQLQTVLEHYKVKHFIGLGVGAGASILLQYALKHEAQVRGLVLISLVADSVGIGERVTDYVGSLVSSYRSGMLSRWFDSKWLSEHRVEADVWAHHAETLNRQNVSAFAQAVQDRPSLQSQLKQLSCRVMCFSGRGSSAHEQQLDTYGEMNVHSSTLLEFDSGGVLLHIQEQEKMVTPLALFIDGFGIMHAPSSTA